MNLMNVLSPSTSAPAFEDLVKEHVGVSYPIQSEAVKSPSTIYTIRVDDQVIGYKNSYKSAMRIVKQQKRDLLRKAFIWDRTFQWVEWKPKAYNQQHFVLESRLKNSLFSYSSKVHEIKIERIDYLN